MKKLFVIIILSCLSFASMEAANPSFNDLMLNRNGLYPNMNFMGGGFPGLDSRMSTNGLVHVMSFGDSYAADGNNGIYGWIFDSFNAEYGFGGVIGSGRAIMNPTVSGGAYTTNDLTTWWQLHYVLPPGGAVTFTSIGWTSLTGNVYEIDFLASNGFGGFKVETNAAGAGFNQAIAAVVANTNAGIGPAGVPLRFTNASSVVAPMQFRVTSLSNTVKILSESLLNLGTNGAVNGGAVYHDFSGSGQDIGQFMAINTNITGPIFRAWDPQLIVIKLTDNVDTLVTNAPLVSGFLSYWCTNADVVWWAGHPMQSPTLNTDIRRQNYVIMTNAYAWGQNYYGDGYDMFGSFQRGLNMGYLQNGDVHCTPSGNRYAVNQFFKVLQPFDTGSRRFWNGPSRKAMVTDIDFDFYNNLNFRGDGQTHEIAWLNGTKNTQLYMDPTALVPRLILRSQGTGTGPAFDWGNNGVGTEEFAPDAGAAAGVPINIGRTGGKTFDGIIGTNIQSQANIFTMGNGTIVVGTNNTPNFNMPNGSLCLVTDGRFYVRTNNAWVQH